jgi:hypothetical protein
MTDDEVLSALAHSSKDPRAERDELLLERLALGELSADEQREVEQRSAEDPRFREQYQLYRPFSEAESRALAASTNTQSGATPRRSARVTWLAGTLAAAAAAALVMTRGTWQSSDAAVPSYRLSIQGAISERRSTHDQNPGPGPQVPGLVRMDARTPPSFLLRPDRSHAERLAVQVFVADPTGAWKPTPVEIERSADGALRVRLVSLPSVERGMLGIRIAEGSEQSDRFDTKHLRAGRDFKLDFELIRDTGPRPLPQVPVEP